MGTNGLLTILDKCNNTKFKIVAGCSMRDIEALGKKLLKINPDMLSVVSLYRLALKYIGCDGCLFVIDKGRIYPNPPEGDDVTLYRSTFECPHFNPRWSYGTAEQTWLLRHDKQKLMPWLNPTYWIFDNEPFGVIGHTLRTASGVTFDLLNPKPSMLRIGDIAHALARACRFGGHVNAEWYSVAEHSWNCWMRSVALGADAEQQLAVLMHDAAEAFTGDQIKPLKVLQPYYALIEERIEAAIAEKWNIDFEKHYALIKQIDHELLVAEKQRFMTDAETFEFKGQDRIQSVAFPADQLPPTSAKNAFLGAFHGIQKQRKLAKVAT